MIDFLFPTEGMGSQTLRTAAEAAYGGGDIFEISRVLRDIQPGDKDGFEQAWIDKAEDTEERAKKAEAADPVPPAACEQGQGQWQGRGQGPRREEGLAQRGKANGKGDMGFPPQQKGFAACAMSQSGLFSGSPALIDDGTCSRTVVLTTFHGWYQKI